MSEISHCHFYEPHPQHQWGGPGDELYHCVGVPTQQEIDDFYARSPERQWVEDDQADSYQEEH